jgi:hypothetical protein
VQPAAVLELVRDALTQSFSDLDLWFERPEPELAARPGYPGAWSCAEHLEHVCLANHFLLLTIRKGCAKALKRARRGESSEAESDLTRLAALADPQAFEWLPPQHMLPRGGLPLEEVRSRLQEQRRECLALLESLADGEGRLCGINMSVDGLGRLDMYQWLYFLAQHVRYHLRFLEQRRDRS